MSIDLAGDVSEIAWRCLVLCLFFLLCSFAFSVYCSFCPYRAFMTVAFLICRDRNWRSVMAITMPTLNWQDERLPTAGIHGTCSSQQGGQFSIVVFFCGRSLFLDCLF